MSTNPPITVGEITTTPAPGSGVNSPWAQQITNRIVQRFANEAAVLGWAAAKGSQAFALDTGRHYERCTVAGADTWVRTGWSQVEGRTWYNANGAAGSVPTGTPTAVTWNETADSDNFAGPGATTITIPAGLGGLYLVTFVAQMAGATAAGLVRLTMPGRNYDAPIGSAGQIGTVTALVPLAAAATFQAQIFHTQGTAVNITAAVLTVARVGP